MLAWLAQRLATYGYWAVALVVRGEGLGLPLPGETLLLLGGASAGAGSLEIWGVILAAAGGAIVGDTLGYELGRWGGRPFLERYGHLVHLKPPHLARAQAFITRDGTTAVFFRRFIAILRRRPAWSALWVLVRTSLQRRPRLLQGARARARVPDRLPDREGALGRQHLRLRPRSSRTSASRPATSTGCSSGASSARS